MNRIYQGRVSELDTLQNGAKGKVPDDWIALPDWQVTLWRHHALFQRAVNYYTLCLAAMARGMDDPEFQTIALKVAEDSARRDPKHKTDAARKKAIESAAETAKAMISAVKGWRDEVAKTWVQGELRCQDINRPRLEKWGIPIPNSAPSNFRPIDPDDDIPK